MAGLDGYSSAWSLGLYVGGSRESNKDADTRPLSFDERVALQQRERKRQIRENPEVRKELEYEIDRSKRSIEAMKMMLKDLEVRYRKQVAHSRCSAQLTFEYSERYRQIEMEIRHSECVLRSKEKLLHDALNM